MSALGRERLEVEHAGSRREVTLDGDRVVVGASDECDVVIKDDAVSHVHASLERVADAWSVRDLGSRNGTFVNGERITGETALRDGDAITVGRARLGFRGAATTTRPETAPLEPPPELTKREREVLVALCRPMADGNAFTEPAPVRDIATALYVSEAAIKQHLSNLYDKFNIRDGDRRRVRLANAAVNTGAVRLGDLR